ncbi:uncharacterized protein PHALS_10354 [Plasmopara halstedii]|uniref:Uncharacterized protein n=1 Tax=Plasmopara halstedii TaxID=4781 RepID=A0A0N7L506_PLAHL|nr:uncharacterized protein PHALS_10354 [Plasmopara halstedii]CEG40139.1 hypothetical protein PHALS_10354 [Plasmopara halstedii]|eukprot:XP_024576508.1 hypothetical protein PHALS_10354 [Plasmopara halstedii]
MAHIETKDPFGFVGSHVVRKQRRKGGDEHGWLTRYDETLDCYTLFVPGGGEPRLLARGEVMKFLSASNIELYDNDHDVFPPPVKDTTTSRYLGVKLRRPYQASSEIEGDVDEDVRGQVTSFLPFGNRYCVNYEDGSTSELSESAVIDGMIALIKSPFFSSPSRQKTRKKSIRTRNSALNLNDDVVSVRRKRQRVETFFDQDVQEIPLGSVAIVENATSPQNDDDVIIIDQMKVEAGSDTRTESAPNILQITNGALTTPREISLEMASHPVEEDMLVDDEGTADLDSKILSDSSDISRKSASKGSASDSTESDAIEANIQKSVPSYVIHKTLHEAVEPLPRRAMAFELLRASLLNLLDRPEVTKVKIAMQYDLLRNPDIRDRDAVVRFMDADGLFVLNTLLSSFATEVIEDEKTESLDESTTRGPPGRLRALPNCLNSLAKWIKSSWIKNIPPAKQQSRKTSFNTQQTAHRSHQKARRGGRGGSSGRPSIQLNRRSKTSPEGEHFAASNTEISRLSRSGQTPSQLVPSLKASPLQSLSQRRVSGGLKPDWLRRKENLSLARFCIDDNASADTRLYQNSQARPISDVSVAQKSPSSDQHVDAGGPDGVFGRAQRLRFGKCWSTQEFGINDPPGTLRQPPKSTYPISSYGRSQYSNQSESVQVPPMPFSSHRPRSILRQISRYNDEPAIDGPGS